MVWCVGFCCIFVVSYFVLYSTVGLTITMFNNGVCNTPPMLPHCRLAALNTPSQHSTGPTQTARINLLRYCAEDDWAPSIGKVMGEYHYLYSLVSFMWPIGAICLELTGLPVVLNILIMIIEMCFGLWRVFIFNKEQWLRLVRHKLTTYSFLMMYDVCFDDDGNDGD